MRKRKILKLQNIKIHTHSNFLYNRDSKILYIIAKYNDYSDSIKT